MGIIYKCFCTFFKYHSSHTSCFDREKGYLSEARRLLRNNLVYRLDPLPLKVFLPQTANKRLRALEE